MERIIQSMQDKYLLPSLDLVEDVFAKWDNPKEGKTVRQLVEEIRSKKYYIPELELIMVHADTVIGYAMFSRFHIEGRYENELLILTPVAVNPSFKDSISQRIYWNTDFKKPKLWDLKQYW